MQKCSSYLLNTAAMPHRVKGDPIRIIGGTYIGRIGWKNKEKGETECEIHLILQAVKEGDSVVLPEKRVRINKDHYMPFIKAVTQVQVVMEQKPKLQAKMTDLVKELVKLDVKPTEDLLVLFGYQWLTMWERKMEQKAVDFTKVDEVPEASDDEVDAAEID